VAVERNMAMGTIVLRSIYKIRVQVMQVAAVVIRVDKLKINYEIFWTKG